MLLVDDGMVLELGVCSMFVSMGRSKQRCHTEFYVKVLKFEIVNSRN